MQVNRGSYPHPVLDASDDVKSYFDVSNVAVLPGIEDIGLNFDLRTDDPTLHWLLSEGAARLSLRWRCSATLATDEGEPAPRKALSDGSEYEFWIDHKQVRGAVQADIRVILAKPLVRFSWERQHPDYGDAVFDLGVGDVIADGGSFQFEADKLYDPLNPPVGSCFKFVVDTSVRRGMRVTFEDDEAVLVRLPLAMHRDLALLGPRPELQISIVVLPALIETISFIKREREVPSEDWGDRTWFGAITNLVEKLGDFEEPAIDLAQKLLNFPVDQSLSLEADAEDEEE